MKKTITILGLVLLMISCNSNESKMKSGIKDYLDKNAKDPKSYEFVELKIIDTVIVGELAKNKVDFNNLMLKESEENLVMAKDNLEKATGYNKQYNTSDFDVDIETAKSRISSNELDITEYKKAISDYSKFQKSKEILGYVASHKFRMKNGFGALDLSEMSVEFDKDFNFLEMNKDTNYEVFNEKLKQP
jgi:hypothetical protein